MLNFYVKFYGAMVAAKDLRVYFCVFKLGIQALGGKEIVYSPTGVPLAGLEAVAPPGIDSLKSGVEMPPGVCESCLQKVGHLLPFLVREAGVVAVGLGVLEVYLLVRHVHVSAYNHWFLIVQAFEISPESVFPFHTVGESFKLFL